MKKFLGIILAVLCLLGLAVNPAHAATAGNNDVTDSWANVSADEIFSLDVPTTNTAHLVGYLIGTGSDTGNNSVDGGLVNTGPAGVLTVVSTGANTNSLLGYIGLDGQTAAGNNHIEDSWVSANASRDMSITVDGNNLAALVGSIISGHANTGENNANNGGTVNTGEAGMLVGSGVGVNRNTANLGVDFSGDTSAQNAQISDDSHALANAESDLSALVDNHNFATLVGNVVSCDGNSHACANTGFNQANGTDGERDSGKKHHEDEGSGGGSVVTGSAGFGAELSTTANNNLSNLDVLLGGNTKAGNTGIEDSNANANADSRANAAVINHNGAFMVGNIVDCGDKGDCANTGYNDANGGNGENGGNGGTIQTGGAATGVSGTVAVNTNSSQISGVLGGDVSALNSGIGEGKREDHPGFRHEDGESNVNAAADSNVSAEIDNHNIATDVVNEFTLSVNTGYNEANGGSKGHDLESLISGLPNIDTGDAVVLADSAITANTNTSLISGSFGGDVSAQNTDITDSHATADANQGKGSSTSVVVDNHNCAEDVATQIDASANTGNNGASGKGNESFSLFGSNHHHDGGNAGSIVTGDILSLINATDNLNHSTTAVLGSFGGEVTAGNSGIDDSHATAAADSSTAVTVDNHNSAEDVATTIDSNLDTGNNLANGSGKGSGGSINTGSILAGVTVNTTANTNSTLVAGTGGGDTSATNTNVNDSHVTSKATSDNSTTVSNGNSAEITNTVTPIANTGGNIAVGGGSGSISTGDAVNGVSVSTTANTNNTAVVTTAGNASATNTGIDDSHAQSTANSTTNTTVSNTNTASVTNNVSSNTNTGDNHTSSGGTVTTGGAAAVTTGSTTTNSNTTTLVITH